MTEGASLEKTFEPHPAGSGDKGGDEGGAGIQADRGVGQGGCYDLAPPLIGLGSKGAASSFGGRDRFAGLEKKGWDFGSGTDGDGFGFGPLEVEATDGCGGGVEEEGGGAVARKGEGSLVGEARSFEEIGREETVAGGVASDHSQKGAIGG